MLLSTLSLVAGLLVAETPDSLNAVTIVADRGAVVSRTDTIQIRNTISVTDAFSGTPGIYLSDYGGAAGLKTASLRGLGSPHAAIYVDGVRVGNVQSGQPDLGMLDMANCSSAVVDYAQNSISFITARPELGNRRVGGTARFRGGSFGTYEPSGRLDFRLSDRICLSATAGGTVSKGNFPLQDGTVRINNDIHQLRTGVDSWGTLEGGDWHAKAYFNGAQRGTPGSLDWPSSDRQKDRNAFLQGLVHKQFTPLYMLSASAKASCDDLLYISEWGNSHYRQTGIQLNSSHKFGINRWFDACAAADLQWDALASDMYNAARTSVLATATAAFHPGRFKADVALEYTGTFDRGGAANSILSPSADLRWNAFPGLDMTAFARRAYRTPTFNELYYPGYGNPELKAEDAWLTDLGLEFNRALGKRWRIQAKSDVFFNRLKNKIISAPTEADPNIWLPYNVGVVQMAGADASTALNYSGGIWKSSLHARYSYQNATDRTTGSYSYGQQIPYVSRHSVCLGAGASCKGWNAELNWNWRGGRCDSAGPMPDYHTLDLTAGKEFGLPRECALGLKIAARNLTGCRYELAGGYPMPGRAFYCELDVRF